ncbi:Flp pilus assembly protein CpaB [Sphingobium sp. TCM1]|uniref:Flp pilus assembly protein CpaB n=1 Tax=Sphingobium sp. TCM1 TaxID=453246 RepID=UPI0007F33D79|nr:Flp pilus assembly protein CpaB [Sphingobium sp. TCM1]OAN56590.1 Flp pilus assembly protein CpaB [Sphingobium sp. TCM1]
MQGRNIIVVAVAVSFGLGAVVLGNAYFSGYEKQQEKSAEAQRLVRLVVASQDLPFGAQLGPQNVRMVNWPAQSVPTGAFTDIEQLTKTKRVALRPVVAGEPLLASKISGSDGRATLSTTVPVGKLAYAIPINDVSGVGGFVRPGDVVDVLLTRPIPGDGAGANDKMTDVVVEAVPVLGIDQVADSSQTKAAIAKSATLQVDARQAQKLALSIQLGQLSLALRNVADAQQTAMPTVLPRHLSTTNIYMPRRTGGATPPAASAMPALFRQMAQRPAPAPRRAGPTMTVVRGSNPSDYEVQHGY